MRIHFKTIFAPHPLQKEAYPIVFKINYFYNQFLSNAVMLHRHVGYSRSSWTMVSFKMKVWEISCGWNLALWRLKIWIRRVWFQTQMRGTEYSVYLLILLLLFPQGSWNTALWFWISLWTNVFVIFGAKVILISIYYFFIFLIYLGLIWLLNIPESNYNTKKLNLEQSDIIIELSKEWVCSVKWFLWVVSTGWPPKDRITM